MDIGLEAAGFTSVGAIELDHLARQTLAANRPEWPILDLHDVVEAGEVLMPADLGMEPRELTVLAGGPPCQPFSMAAQWSQPKRGIDDDRGKTVGGMLKIAERFLPQAILIENVTGFLQGRNSAATIISDHLDRINVAHGTHYRLNHWVLNAADFGVPQNRRRAIGVAFRDLDESDAIPAPIGPFEGAHLTAWDAIGHLRPSEVPAAEGGYSDLLPSIPEGANYQYLTARGGGPEVELFGYRTRYWSFLLKLRRDAPAWTLPASPGPSTGPFHWDNRPLAIEERLALQGMPHTWKLAGTHRDAVKLTGNATPSPLAESMGRYILAKLESPALAPSPDEIRPTLAPKRRSGPPAPTPPTALPDRWRSQVGSKAAHPGAGAGPSRHLRPSE